LLKLTVRLIKDLGCSVIVLVNDQVHVLPKKGWTFRLIKALISASTLD